MINLSSPLAALHRAATDVDKVASRVARAAHPNVDHPSGDTVDLSSEMVALLAARHNFATSIKVVQTADEMTKSVLNLLG